MRSLLGLAVAVWCFTALTVPASAGGCPVAGRDEKLALLAKVRSCNEAAALFKRCAIGASLDAMLTVPVEEVCERSRLVNLSPEERKAYEAAIHDCNAPYVRKRGTIYRSIAAHCRVEVMAKYATGR